jgi:hypothetical protein
MLGHIKFERARDLAAEPVFFHFLRRDDTGFSGAQVGIYFGYVVSDGGDNPHPCDHDTAHGYSLSGVFLGVWERGERGKGGVAWAARGSALPSIEHCGAHGVYGRPIADQTKGLANEGVNE